MTIQERNDYLAEQFWFMKEKQHLFDLSNLKEGHKYNKYSDILQLVGIDKEGRKSHYAVHKANLDHFICTKKQKDGQIKITKIKGEYIENPFSWELRSPFMGINYMMEMMIIHILDNHINENWDKNKWCEVLGLIPAKKKDYDLDKFDKYPGTYFDTAYESMQNLAHGRFYNLLVSMENRGIIRQKKRIVCGSSPFEPLRDLTEKERKIYEDTLCDSLRIPKHDLDITTVRLYPEVYPKFLKALKSHKEFSKLYFKYVIEPEYLYPDEHSYLREYEFYTYQKRIQQIFKPKVLKNAQSKKEELIKNLTAYYSCLKEFPEGTPQDVIDSLTSVYELSTTEFWSKRYARYGTDVRKVVDMLFQGGKKHWIMGPSFIPQIGS